MKISSLPLLFLLTTGLIFAIHDNSTPPSAAQLPVITTGAGSTALLFPAPERLPSDALTGSNRLRRQIGIHRQAREASTTIPVSLPFIRAENGSYETSVHISATGAQAMRIGLQIRALSDGAQLQFISAAALHRVSGTAVNAAIQANIAAKPSDPASRTYWSPTLTGDSALLRITSPTTTHHPPADLTISAISHFFEYPPSVEEADGCHIDVNCSSQWSKTSRATAKMIITDGGDSFTCTGTLVNDTDPATTIPYFISANHCIPTQTVASSLETLWFYTSATCNSSSINPAFVTIGGGATLLWGQGMSQTATGGNMNISFMKLNEAPPAGVHYADWSTGSVGPGQYYSLHHPGGNLQKISSGQRGNLYDCWMQTATSFYCVQSAAGNFVRVDWEGAGAQAGSYGAGLYASSTRKITAIVSGGSGPSCISSHSYSSLFSSAYTQGDLGKWLNPPISPTPRRITVAPLNYLLLKKE